MLRRTAEAARFCQQPTPDALKLLIAALSQPHEVRSLGLKHLPALGGHVDACDDCCFVSRLQQLQEQTLPQVPRAAARTWFAERQADLLPVGYFYVVFTLPVEIAAIAFPNKAVVYELLFKAASETMLTIAADPRHLGARIGITAMLRTWGGAGLRLQRA